MNVRVKKLIPSPKEFPLEVGAVGDYEGSPFVVIHFQDGLVTVFDFRGLRTRTITHTGLSTESYTYLGQAEEIEVRVK